MEYYLKWSRLFWDANSKCQNRQKQKQKQKQKQGGNLNAQTMQKELNLIYSFASLPRYYKI